MDIMALSGFLMVIVLAVLLVIGTPIAVSIGISSIVGILPTLEMGSA